MGKTDGVEKRGWISGDCEENQSHDVSNLSDTICVQTLSDIVFYAMSLR